LRLERRRLEDHIRPGARVLFVGINPGLRSAELGHHFAGPTNRFWKLLRDSRLVPEPIGCEDDARLPEWGYGITNLIARPSAGIGELERREYEAGRRRLLAKVRSYRPRLVALVGVTLYRALFPSARREARKGAVGLRPEALGGAPLFVLPNPSGRNANFSYAEMLEAFVGLRRVLEGRA
jgi:TDG/mug DNA glycosylase family protein